MVHSHIVQRLLESRVKPIQEHETPDGKLPAEKVVYLNPDQTGGGCHCGGCMFFNADSSQCLLTSPAKCNAENGVCALFLGGESIFEDDDTPQERITKDQAGYVEDAPTRCANCEYFTPGEGEVGECEKVGGTKIYTNGCCNGWESAEKEAEEEAEPAK
jgi:hypothetical protein